MRHFVDKLQVSCQQYLIFEFHSDTACLTQPAGIGFAIIPTAGFGDLHGDTAGAATHGHYESEALTLWKIFR